MDDPVVEKAFKALNEDVNSHFFVERTTYDNYNELRNLRSYNVILDTNVMKNLKKPENCIDCPKCDAFIGKFCCNLEEIMKKWEKICLGFSLSPINCNYYFIYWLYGKIKGTKCNNRVIYYLDSKLKSKWKCIHKGNTCVNKYLYIEDINVLKNKKELYDFTEYYSAIKSILKTGNSSNKDTYCKYIDYIFDLYEKIHKDYKALYSGYYDNDIERFKTKFNNVTDEINFLKDKCSQVQVDLVFDKTSNSIKKIKEGVFKDFVNEKFPDLKYVEKDHDFKDSTLHKFYSKLNQNYYGDISTSDTSVSVDDNYIKKNDEFNKIWNNIQKIKVEWEKEFAEYDELSSNQKCEYFNYWLYDKLKDNIEPPKVIPFFYKISELLNKEKHCKSRKFEFHIEQIPNKKRLHDFVEIYEIIKDKLNNSEKTNKEKYCKYIKAFFDLYKHMEQDTKGLHGYRDEIIHFKSKFYENVSELTFLNNKCPGKCLKYIFTNNYERNCSPEEQSKDGTGEGDNICLFENNSTEPYELIQRYSEIHNKYEEFNKDDNSEYYKTYCTKLNTPKCQNKGVDKICVNLVKNLIHLSGMPQDKERDERCYLLKHWLYNEIRKIFSAKYNDVSKEPVIAELKDVVYHVNNYYLHDKPCYCDFVGTLNTWKEEKLLHDYFQSYDKIESEIKEDSGKCNNYFDNLVAINKLYEEHFGKCCYCYRSGDCYDSCPGYFKCDDKYNPYNIFVKLDCKEEISKSFKKVNKPQGIDNYVITESIRSYLLALKSKFDLFDFVTLSAFGILGILMIFFIFYKFTPLGRGSHKKGYSNEITMNNLRENFERELAQSTPRNVNGRGDAKRIRIAYQTA
ncbi:VIR protein [Plasmodium vivax]|uniref:VIR protein n=1 Tax=Plasmodium vivax TaxID=5855 RepID=A0A1G4HJH9_PLAVI|nr:VIR protein [Plasmodium vivax]